jgi:hypothetical protein
MTAKVNELNDDDLLHDLDKNGVALFEFMNPNAFKALWLRAEGALLTHVLAYLDKDENSSLRFDALRPLLKNPALTGEMLTALYTMLPALKARKFNEKTFLYFADFCVQELGGFFKHPNTPSVLINILVKALYLQSPLTSSRQNGDYFDRMALTDPRLTDSTMGKLLELYGTPYFNRPELLAKLLSERTLYLALDPKKNANSSSTVPRYLSKKQIAIVFEKTKLRGAAYQANIAHNAKKLSPKQASQYRVAYGALPVSLEEKEKPTKADNPELTRKAVIAYLRKLSADEVVKVIKAI